MKITHYPHGEARCIDQGIENSGHFPMHDNADDLWNIVADAVRSYRARY